MFLSEPPGRFGPWHDVPETHPVPNPTVPFRIIVLLALSITLPATARNGPPDPIVLGPELDERIQLVQGWRYHPGDDPAWADPDLDDSAWPVVDSLIRDPDAMPGGWPGIGWFRQRLRLAPGMPSTALALRPEHYGACEVYLDGHLAASFGSPAAVVEAERPMYSNDFIGIPLQSGVTHVLAVRYSNAAGNLFWKGQRGFWVNLRSVRSASNSYYRWTLAVTVWEMAYAGAMSALALLHLLLFLFHPKARENLAVSVYAAVIAAHLVAFMKTMQATSLPERLLAYKVMYSLLIASVVAGLAVVLILLRRRPGPVAWLIAAAGASVATWVWTWSEFRVLDPYHTMFVLISYGAILSITGRAVVRRVPDAWIVAAGFVPIAAGTMFEAAWNLTGIEQTIDIPSGLLLLPLPLALSLFVSRRAARTSRDLEVKLVEVKELSREAIEQQRRAAHQEAQRLILEAEIRRRGGELEAARRLQLAMLPPESPRLEGYDMAFRVETATEVGGDYVDVRPDDGNGTLLAVGDATSHGLQAGMVVAVVKSLFQGSASDDLPVDVLRRIDSGLKTMHERHASMAMAVLRLEKRRLLVSSAGMPPLLILRGATGEVEEVLLPGLPLGTATETDYAQSEVVLESGDAVVVMTDGLVEALDDHENYFGYERATAELRKMTGRGAAGVVGGMFAAVSSYQGERAPQDDITVVALVVR